MGQINRKGGGGRELLVGPEADRPAGGSDLYYFAVDTGRLWRWSAAGWALAGLLLLTPVSRPELIGIGDSITYGDQVGGPAGSWLGQLARTRGWQPVVNAGVNGSTLARGGTAPMVDRWSQAVPAGYGGHVTLFGGTNDYDQDLPLGVPGGTDPATIHGALLVMGRALLDRGPLTLHFLTPLWRGDAGRTEGTRRGTPGYTLEQVRQAIRTVGAQLARERPGRVSVIDLGHELWDAAQSAAYMGADLLHPNAAGHALMAQHLAARLDVADASTTDPFDLRSLADGSVHGIEGWQVLSGSGVMAGGALTVDADFLDGPGVIHLVGTPRPVRVRALVGENTILKAFLDAETNRSIGAWLFEGKPFFGEIDGSSVDTWHTGAPLPAGHCWIEIERVGGTLSLRAWPENGVRPVAATYSRADIALDADAIGFADTGTDDAHIKQIILET